MRGLNEREKALLMALCLLLIGAGIGFLLNNPVHWHGDTPHWSN